MNEGAEPQKNPPTPGGKWFIGNNRVPTSIVGAEAAPAIGLKRKELGSDSREPSPGDGEEPGHLDVLQRQSAADETDDVLP